jgi:hypothetical protein
MTEFRDFEDVLDAIRTDIYEQTKDKSIREIVDEVNIRSERLGTEFGFSIMRKGRPSDGDSAVNVA